MKTTFALLLALLATPAIGQSIRQQGFTTNATGAVINAQGSRINDLLSLGITNGNLTVQTNSQFTAGSGTNDNRGLASVLVGGVKTTNAFNVLTDRSSLMVVSSGGASTGHYTNQIVSTGGGNMMVAAADDTSNLNTNVFSIEGSSAGTLMLAARTGSGRGSAGRNVSRVNSSKGSLVTIVPTATSGNSDSLIDSGAASVVAVSAGVSTNLIGSLSGAVVAVRMDSGISSHTTGQGSILALFSAVGSGSHSNASPQGFISAVYNAGGSNKLNIARGGVLGGAAFAGGQLNFTFGPNAQGGSSMFGMAGTNNSLTMAADGAFLAGAADLTSAGVTGFGAFMWGSGYTNKQPRTAMFGYNAAWQVIRTNGYHSISDIIGADETVDWNMATNAYMGRVTLPAASQSVFITNAIVTADSVVTATINSDDTTAISVLAIPTAGQLQLKAVAAATADTKISWVVHAP